ncbi:lysine N(6)-hydroxylase/L-ornithine N(5)-oxygenase family protein [Candidatus Sororendozoicomonas aggregata]|uniref:lysine N(6)-hydroxylase/L-ornithine N(5)-oxygenase family protein n=1 Tax=Candidatus Sororendozoicomonas aggregata TaxID=3073239 RepID=UPI002ED1C6D9
MSVKIYDVIGIGVGPFNLSLACLVEPIKHLDTVFFDKAPGFDWHPGMMLEGSHLQTPFMSDLVTLADPTSPYSFLNFLKEQGRLYSFYIRENFFILRKEYNDYCQWATKRLNNLQFNSEVVSIDHYRDSGSKDEKDEKDVYQVTVKDTLTEKLSVHFARRLVIGTGPVSSLPLCCEDDATLLEQHSSRYLSNKAALQKQSAITVLGSGQSAAEIVYDLLQDIDQFNYTLSWITRSPRYFPLEYTKLTLEMTSPEYVDYFYGLSNSRRQQLIDEQKNLYKGINSELINDIYDLLYAKKLNANIDVNLQTNAALHDIKRLAQGRGFALSLYNEESEESYTHTTKGLVFATGYQHKVPGFLQNIASAIRWDDQHGTFNAHRNYTIDHQQSCIFVQNAEINTHGFVTPDLGMACYRNAHIIKSLLGEAYYPIESRIAFQTFGAPKPQDKH